jgi:hypothetical protein
MRIPFFYVAHTPSFDAADQQTPFGMPTDVRRRVSLSRRWELSRYSATSCHNELLCMEGPRRIE